MRITPNWQNVKPLGRTWPLEEGLWLAFSASGAEFTFTGCTCEVTIAGDNRAADAEAVNDHARIAIELDGRRAVDAQLNVPEKVFTLEAGEGEHTVRIVKLSETAMSTCIINTIEAENIRPTTNKSCLVEFIGDSITCGYGVLGLHTDSTYRTYQQDVTRSYAGITAERFGADARFIAISGKGIVCNCNGDRTDIKTGEYYNRQSRTGGICNDGWVADVVVINIGTNDCGGPAPNDEFEQAARDLVAKVRDRYPEAHIIWLYGMMSQLYSEVLRDTLRDISKKDEKVHFMFADTMYGNEPETGANGHPNVRCSVRVSNMLYKKIRSLTGWRNKVTLPEEE